MPRPKVGPQRVGHPDLRVRDLPQQEVAHPHLAAGANQQIGIGLSGRVQELREAPLIEVRRMDGVLDGPPRRRDDLRPPAVVDGDVEQHAAVAASAFLPDVELAPDVGRQLVRASDDPEPDVVVEQRLQLEPHVLLEQRHQQRHLGGGPLPVLDRESIEGQNPNPQPGGRLHHVPDRIDTRPMALHPGQMPLGRPPAVAVHDDGHVRRQTIEVHLSGERRFARTGRSPGQQLFETHPRIRWRGTPDPTGPGATIAQS